jgi:two-component system sensor histidine kinase KdpD
MRSLLETFGTQIALAIERDQLATVSRTAQLQIEAERTRSALLSAVSHDLRTPLSAIAGASSTLQTSSESLDATTRAELLGQITEEASRLSRLVENLLHMTRLAGGEIAIVRHWQPVDEVIGSAISRMRDQLSGRAIDVRIPDEMPLGHFDEVLVEQLLVNLLDNAVKYSSPNAPIEIRAEPMVNGIAVEVADRGPGLAAGDEKRIFEMFYRAADSCVDRRGAGLGLAICQAIARAHHGAIEAVNRAGGGTVFRFTLPYDGQPPILTDLVAK